MSAHTNPFAPQPMVENSWSDGEVVGAVSGSPPVRELMRIIVENAV